MVFAPGAFAGRAAKTAHGVIAYSRDVVVAVVDPEHAGKRVRDVVPYLRSDAPIIATVRESLVFEPTSLLIGIAPPGGALPPQYRAEIAVALQSRLEVVNGLHSFLNDDAEMRALADKHDSRIWDLRMPPAAPLFSGAAYDVASRIVLTVGSDCAVGKMTAALELTRAAQAAGAAAEFVPTGQTGIAIAGWGTSVDRVIADFASGASRNNSSSKAKRRVRFCPTAFCSGRRTRRHRASRLCAGHPGVGCTAAHRMHWCWCTW